MWGKRMSKCKFGNDLASSVVQAVTILKKNKELFPSIAPNICSFIDVDFYTNKLIDKSDIRNILEKYKKLVSGMSSKNPAYDLFNKFLNKISLTMIDGIQGLIAELQGNFSFILFSFIDFTCLKMNLIFRFGIFGKQ